MTQMSIMVELRPHQYLTLSSKTFNKAKVSAPGFPLTISTEKQRKLWLNKLSGKELSGT